MMVLQYWSQVNCDCTVIKIINYDPKTFIVLATVFFNSCYRAFLQILNETARGGKKELLSRGLDYKSFVATVISSAS